jgi:hypothetical protein
VRLTALVAATIALTVTADAQAYVRNRTADSVPVAWPGSCVFIQPDSAGTPDLPADMVFATVQKALHNWTSADASCSYLQLSYVPPAPLEAHLDGKNIVKFRTDKWCHPDDAQEHDVCYSPAATGITTVFYVDKGAHEGTLLDADIELNNINFTFVIEPTTQEARPGTLVSDLENTLTHELGHVQGLDHTCDNGSSPPQETDPDGNKVPACDSLSLLPAAEQQAIENATMFPSATPGETKKRMPGADDVAGICAAYPRAKDPMVCKPINLSDYGGCSIIGRAPRSIGFALVILLALAALATRRRG